MPKTPKKSKAPDRPAAAVKPRPLSLWAWSGFMALAVVLVHGVPLVSTDASIQWDAVDVHYCSQKYFADSLRSGHFPFWTPFIFSGFPFLADPQVGAFYPLNWPFFLFGPGPKAIQAELALHTLLALTGAFLLLLRFVPQRPAAFLGALTYALSGFFAAHSSHVGMFQAAALAPWLLYLFDRALEGPFSRFSALAALCGGILILAGHFQTALYSFAALALFAVARTIEDRRRAARAAAALALVAVLAAGLSAVVALPGLELTRQSIRASANYAGSEDGTLRAGALTTLVFPDSLGVLSGKYHGPGDVTQYYFYAGLLLLPLAAFGLRDSRVRWAALLLVLPALWYMLGPAFGLYHLGAAIPGLHKVRAPVHGWFVVALGLSLLAAAGFAALTARFGMRWLTPALLVLISIDLMWHNAWNNSLAWQRASFEETYRSGERLLAERVQPLIGKNSRFLAPDKLASLGPMNSPLQVRLETTYGYNPLELASYAEYRSAMASNPALEAALASVRLNPQNGALETVPGALPRAWFPRSSVIHAGAGTGLTLLNPTAQVLVSPPAPPIQQDGAVEVESLTTEEQTWRIKTRTSSPGLLVLSLPYYPGWRAISGGRPLPLTRVNHALSGIVAPAGQSEIILEFHSNYFAGGAAVSTFSLVVIAGLVLLGRRKPRSPVPAAE